MKRWIALILTLLLVSSLLTGCGTKQTNKDYFHDYLTVEATAKKFNLDAGRESKSAKVGFGDGVSLPASDDLYDFSQSWNASGVKFWDFTGEMNMTASGYRYGKETFYGDSTYGFEATISPRLDDFDYTKAVREISKYYSEHYFRTEVEVDTPDFLRCAFSPADDSYQLIMEVTYESGRVTTFTMIVTPQEDYVREKQDLVSNTKP